MNISGISTYGFHRAPAETFRQNLPAVNGGTASSLGESGSAAGAKSGADATEEFMSYVKGTPEQRMFKSFLARQGMKQEDFDALSLEERRKLEAKFREELEEQAQAGSGKTKSVDIVV